MSQIAASSKSARLSFEEFKQEVLGDYRIVVASREASLIGRREVLTGKAKFGIFGDGKELAQLAAAKCFKPGDIRSGYYRDQTLMFATGMSDIQKFFAQLYADMSIENEPSSAGRMMNGHYGTRWLDDNGDWKDLTKDPQSSSDISPTAGQMIRALGLAYASKMYRNVDELQTGFEKFSNKGNEVVFCTIGDASTSEGLFWESVNAAGVLQVPLAIFIWDDGYGISVPRKLQTTKGSISALLEGFQKKEGTNGVDIYRVKAWDYAGMCEVFEAGIRSVRQTHTPAVFHVEEVTQPQGHSTSGSHERYKSPERLEWEREWDGIRKMKEWLIENALADEDELNDIETAAKDFVRDSRNLAWQKYQEPIRVQVDRAVTLIREMAVRMPDSAEVLGPLASSLAANREPGRKEVLETLYQAIGAGGRGLTGASGSDASKDAAAYYRELLKENEALY